MAEIVKVFRDRVPALRFIGKEYADFSGWGEWFQNAWFDRVESCMGGVGAVTKLWKNGGGYTGLERRAEDGALLSYHIGMFAPPDTVAPQGFLAMDFPEGSFGTVWIRGREDEVHDAIPLCLPALLDAGFVPKRDREGAILSFENGLCPRFTTPDGEGKVILDYVYLIE